MSELLSNNVLICFMQEVLSELKVAKHIKYKFCSFNYPIVILYINIIFLPIYRIR